MTGIRHSTIKRCSKCGIEKTATREFFTTDPNTRDGFDFQCKVCRASAFKTRYSLNPEKYRKRALDWYHAHPEASKKTARRTYLKHKQQRDDWNRLWRNSSEKYRSWKNSYYNANYRRIWAGSSLQKHRQRGFITEISIDELHFLAQQTENCRICGVQLSWDNRFGTTHKQSPTIDRLNNDKVLRLDNVQIVCHQCNTTKGSRDMAVFIEYCRRIADRFVVNPSARLEVPLRQ